MVSYDFILKNKITYLENRYFLFIRSHHMWIISPCISSPNKISFNWFSLKSHVCLTHSPPSFGQACSEFLADSVGQGTSLDAAHWGCTKWIQHTDAISAGLKVAANLVWNPLSICPSPLFIAQRAHQGTDNVHFYGYIWQFIWWPWASYVPAWPSVFHAWHGKLCKITSWSDKLWIWKRLQTALLLTQSIIRRHMNCRLLKVLGSELS